MSRLHKAVAVGFFTGILGLLISLAPFGLDLEEALGLDLLFKLRGQREVPAEIVIVTMDKVSSDNLNLPAEPRKWPRSLHARLIENLISKGVSLIAFDIIFDEPHSPDNDSIFARAIDSEGNVVLGEYIKRDLVQLDPETGGADVSIETLVPPFAPLAQAAVALAPFPLPKVPVKVSQYWTFKTSAGDTPTLPVVAYQVFAAQVYDEFFRMLKKSSTSAITGLPKDKETLISGKNVDAVVRNLRDIFQQNPLLSDKMLKELAASSIDQNSKSIVTSLIKMYQSPNSHYLNFYGPPGTIRTIPYFELVQTKEPAGGGEMDLDFKDKAIFIGLSERLRPEQKDGFYTTFSQPSGVDISGVEIAATAFANLLEDMPVRQLSLVAHLVVILFWGMLVGSICRLFPTMYSALAVIALSALYLMLAWYQFNQAAIWYPLASNLYIQAPAAFLAAMIWKYFEAHRERQNIKKAFGYYLPEKMVDQLAKDVAHIQSGAKIVYGTCLCTDAEQYTTLSEAMDPEELRAFLNKYYEAVFEPVKTHGGVVSDVIGDSMMALWTTTHPDAKLRSQACLAALEISRAVDQFNQTSHAFQLPTRIGLHSGHLALGSVGAINHFEYRAVGDIVNTVSRIESLNKQLGTSILVSTDVMHELDDFLARELGEFLLSGKSNPIVLHELISLKKESSEKQRNLCALFAEALSAYRGQFWEKAIDKFKASLQLTEQDGPSLFYLRLCEKYRENPPGEIWDGLVRFHEK
jgi:adenylate cyclase